jgi:hypothetical protein
MQRSNLRSVIAFCVDVEMPVSGSREWANARERIEG